MPIAMSGASRHSREWTTKDRTGGPVDDVFELLRASIPALIVERLQVTHAADDDNVYFIDDVNGRNRIQIDTWPRGQPPFLIENGGRSKTSDVGEAVAITSKWLGKTGPRLEPGQ